MSQEIEPKTPSLGRRIWTRIYKRYLLDALTAMGQGLFASLIIGLILSQLGQIPFLSFLADFASVLDASSPVVGAAIGVAVAYGLKTKPLVIFAAAAVGAFGYVSGVGSYTAGPLGAYFAAVVGAEVGNLVAGRTKVDIIVVPSVTIIAGGLTTLLLAPVIVSLMTALQSFIDWATLLQPIPMGIIVSVVVGWVLTAPISSAALCAMIFTVAEGQTMGLGLQLAAGAATAGCCAQMVGFAVSSFRENRWSGLISQGLGTSMLQVPNIIKKPRIILPATIASAITGPLATTVFQMKNASAAAGMGTSGLVGQVGTWAAMAPETEPFLLIVKILVLHILLPAAISLACSEFMRKKGWIQFGDMKLDC